MKFVKHFLLLMMFGFIGIGVLYLLSPGDISGSFGDAALKIFNLCIKVAMFSIGLKALFGFLDFSEIFEKAKSDPGKLAIATSVIILAWAIVLFPF